MIQPYTPSAYKTRPMRFGRGALIVNVTVIAIQTIRLRRKQQ
jgi:hypothetical protein